MFKSMIWSPYGLLLVVVLATHGLILLNDGLYWDDWLHYMRHERGDLEGFKREFFGNGVASEVYTQWAMRYLPFSLRFNYQVVSFLSWLVIAWSTYFIGANSGLVSRFESLGIALFAVVFPSVELSFALFFVTEISSYAAFMLAASGVFGLRGRFGWGIRLGMLLLFAWSFWISTLLVFYLGFILLWWCIDRYQAEESWQQALWRFRYRLDFLLLPIIFWVFKETTLPRTGANASYAKIKLSPNIFYDLYLYVVNGIALPFNEAGQLLGKQPLFLGLVLIVFLYAYPRGIGAWQSQNYQVRLPAMGIVGYGGVLLFLGVFPYALIGRTVIPHHIDTSYGLLLGLPIAILLVGLLRFGFWDSSYPQLGFGLFYALVLLFGILTFQNYVAWQARWVKDEAIIANLRQMPNAADYSTYWIDDRFALGPDVQYKFYEWSNLFRLVWGGESRNAVYVGNLWFLVSDDNYPNYADFFLSDWQPTGCQVLLTIRTTDKPNAYRNEFGLSLRYWAARFFAPSRLSAYLEDLADLELRPILAPQATDCPSQQAYAQSQSDDTVFDPLVSHWTHMRRIQSVIEWERAAETLSPQLPYTYSLFYATHLTAEEKDWFEQVQIDLPFYQRYQLAAQVVPIEYTETD